MATTSECAPELLFLRCSRILTPWEARVDAKRLGYKCKRYARWSLVHVQGDSGDVLARVGSSLLDDGEFPLKEYGHFARVLERVQQWTVDKESLSLPAPLTPGYEQAQRVLLLGSQRRQYVCDFLTDLLGQGVETLTGDQTWVLFKQCVVTQLLQSSRAVKALDLRLQVPESVLQGPAQLKALERTIVELYQALNFVVEANSPGELLNLLLGELGLPVECEVTSEALSVGSSGAASATPTVLIEAKARTDMRFLEVAVVKDSIVLKFNDRHPALSGDSDLASALSQTTLWETFGLACQAQLGMLDDVQSFLDSWGVHLAAASRRAKL